MLKIVGCRLSVVACRAAPDLISEGWQPQRRVCPSKEGSLTTHIVSDKVSRPTLQHAAKVEDGLLAQRCGSSGTRLRRVLYYPERFRSIRRRLRINPFTIKGVVRVETQLSRLRARRGTKS